MEGKLPAGCVTGVGSLPFTDPKDAIDFVAHHCPVLPFWPQLPKRQSGEGVIAQGLGILSAFLEPAARPFCWQIQPGKGRVFAEGLDEQDAYLIPETAAGFFAFEAALRKGEFPRAVALKAQSEGPATLAHWVFHEGRSLANEPGWMRRVAAFVARQAIWQVKRLQRYGRPVIFVLDEPAISLALADAPPELIEEIIHAVATVLIAVRKAGATAGIHCCAQLPTMLLQRLPFQLLSFDAHLPMEGPAWGELVRSVLHRSGSLAFGLVPTNPEPVPGAGELFALWLRLAATAGDVLEMAHKTIVTATCGLGLSTPSAAASVFEQCNRVGEKIERLSQSAQES